MRLQLALAAALVAAPSVARAQNVFVSELQIYTDDDHTEVVSPVVRAQADVAEDTNLSASYVADVVTSASVDVVSQASPKTIHDTRHQVTAALSRAFGDVTLDGGYVFSTENDYTSHVVSLGIDKEMFEKNTTVGAHYSLALNTVGRVDDHNFEEALTVHNVSLSLTQVLSPRAIVQATYALGVANGFQASPYRYVPVMDTGGEPMFWVPETDPEERYRHALVGQLNYFIPEDSAVQLDYRVYRDSWGITSHTIGTRYIVNLSPDVELRLRNRYYTQSRATFYEPHYTELHQFMTVDRELSALWSDTLGGKLTFRLRSWLAASLKVDGFYYNYPEFPALPTRTGANLAAGLRLTY